MKFIGNQTFMQSWKKMAIRKETTQPITGSSKLYNIKTKTKIEWTDDGREFVSEIFTDFPVIINNIALDPEVQSFLHVSTKIKFFSDYLRLNKEMLIAYKN